MRCTLALVRLVLDPATVGEADRLLLPLRGEPLRSEGVSSAREAASTSDSLVPAGFITAEDRERDRDVEPVDCDWRARVGRGRRDRVVAVVGRGRG